MKGVKAYSLEVDTINKISEMFKMQNTYKSESTFVESILNTYISQFHEQVVADARVKDMSNEDFVYVYLKKKHKPEEVWDMMRWSEQDYANEIKELKPLMFEKIGYGGKELKSIIKSQIKRMYDECKNDRVQSV